MYNGVITATNPNRSNTCYSTVTWKVFIESTSMLMNRPQCKLGQFCTNRLTPLCENRQFVRENNPMVLTIQNRKNGGFSLDRFMPNKILFIIKPLSISFNWVSVDQDKMSWYPYVRQPHRHLTRFISGKPPSALLFGWQWDYFSIIWIQTLVRAGLLSLSLKLQSYPYYCICLVSI